ncbi:tyrosine-type recombinase/integrase [Xenorhabdus bovienii]|uniref:tyrosine-type recombinase/integrase n=1 Tax=Xenorhabdus bovienii TaxID=40576 RepID=UPI0023B22D63|nr:tyrosine-type recombinase/integrase [Xenorhabdus bovienii]MDE9427420.1 tyrosine-type recombinase/integrase [Xenorhabdus bovienii]MDE9454373.1 tyrosine-type recombinase/integrase [Xenorhabdus bovienii]MDE9538003.1 tyrosine-type recombinase/integrase [Xenorhabdus bovienii]
MKLSARQIETAKPKDKAYKLSDGGGLHLYISPTGSKSWRLKYRISGKEKLLTIGIYPVISLADARKAREEAKKLLAEGTDPSEIKKKDKEVEEKITFANIFKEWHQFKTGFWSEKYAKEMKLMFDNDILPIIGHMAMEEIEPLILLKVIRLFEERGAMERASKARRRCGEVFRYAIGTGRAKYNPSPDLVDAMTGYRKEHYPFLTIDQIPAFNQALASYSGSVISKTATWVLQYTALRTKEMRSMLWKNIDFENRLITIEPSVMKSRKLHIVPMSNQVIKLLQNLKPMTSSISDFVFPGRNDRKKSISENAVLLVIRRIGYDGLASGHGFRHQFSTILNEHKFDYDVIEKQLAHVDGNGTRGVYNHAQYLEQRREIMQWFADYIDKISRVK